MQTNLPAASNGNSQLNTVFSTAKAWLLALHQFAPSRNPALTKGQLDDKTTEFAQAMSDDRVPLSAFGKDTLTAARKHFTSFPSYAALIGFLPMETEPQASPSDGVPTMKANSLARAAVRRWINDNPGIWADAREGGYRDELEKWLIKAYCRAAFAQEFDGTFRKDDDGNWGYEIGEIPSIRPGSGTIDGWLAQVPAEVADQGTPSGWKRVGSTGYE